jgi:hypothetical protein
MRAETLAGLFPTKCRGIRSLPIARVQPSQRGEPLRGRGFSIARSSSIGKGRLQWPANDDHK